MANHKSWCCERTAAAVDNWPTATIAEDYGDRLQVVKLNIDQNPLIARKYNVRSIPTLLLFKDGDVAAQQVGAVSKAQLTAFVDQHIGSESVEG